jgi:hypothetical protein
MSKKHKTFLSNSKDESALLFTKFSKAILDEGLGFVEAVDIDASFFEISGASTGTNHLQKIVVTDLAKIEGLKEVRKIYLEKEIKGISTKDKSPEEAILVLIEKQETYVLEIILVELKTSLVDEKPAEKGRKKEDSTITQTQNKFQHSLNRLYMLLNFFDYPKIYTDKNILVKFNALLAYNSDKSTKDDHSELYKIFKGITHHPILTCETLLSQNDKIQVKFIPNPDKATHPNAFEVSLKDLF